MENFKYVMLQKDQIFNYHRGTQFLEVAAVQNLLWTPEVAFSFSWSLNCLFGYYTDFTSKQN